MIGAIVWASLVSNGPDCLVITQLFQGYYYNTSSLCH